MLLEYLDHILKHRLPRHIMLWNWGQLAVNIGKSEVLQDYNIYGDSWFN